MTLEHLVSAYTVLAGDDRYHELVWYRGQPTREPRQVLSEDADSERPDGTGVEFLGVDFEANIYAGEVGRERLVKYVRFRP